MWQSEGLRLRQRRAERLGAAATPARKAAAASLSWPPRRQIDFLTNSIPFSRAPSSPNTPDYCLHQLTPPTARGSRDLLCCPGSTTRSAFASTRARCWHYYCCRDRCHYRRSCRSCGGGCSSGPGCSRSRRARFHSGSGAASRAARASNSRRASRTVYCAAKRRARDAREVSEHEGCGAMFFAVRRLVQWQPCSAQQTQ